MVIHTKHLFLGKCFSYKGHIQLKPTSSLCSTVQVKATLEAAFFIGITKKQRKLRKNALYKCLVCVADAHATSRISQFYIISDCRVFFDVTIKLRIHSTDHQAAFLLN